MNYRLGRLALLPLIAASAILASVRLSVAEKEPNYVIFTLLGPEARSSSVGTEGADWAASEQKSVEELRSRFGAQRPGQDRYIGFSFALLPTLNLTPAQLKAQVVLALDLAQSNGIPIFFHADDEHFWWRSPELSKNPEMVEWSDFPKASETSGPIVPRYWLPWGDPPSVYPAPPPCFACPAFRAAMAERLRDCVGEPIAKRLALWRKDGKSYLFAGIAAGNETLVPDFREAARVGWPKSRYGLDTTKGRPTKVPMRSEDNVPIGYHSLVALGHTRESLEKTASESGKSVEEVVAGLFDRVAHDYAEFQAKTLREAGLPRERIYTHFTSSSRSTGDEFKLPDSGRPGSGNLPPSFEAAVNAYSRPGFTIVHDAVNLNRLVAELDRAQAPEHGRAWAAVESYVTTGQPGAPMYEGQYAEYLGGLVAHGAKVVSIYGWVDRSEGAGAYDIKRSGAPAAVKRWLAGETLSPGWSGTTQLARRAAIRVKIEMLQRAARESIRRGRNPLMARWTLRNFEKDFEPLIQAGKLDEAEALLNRTIAEFQTH